MRLNDLKVLFGSSGRLRRFLIRLQAKRSHFRRRQSSSLVATFAEALSSFSWAGAGALAPASTWLAVIQGLFALAIVVGAWFISSARSAARRSSGPSNTLPKVSRSFRWVTETLNPARLTCSSRSARQQDQEQQSIADRRITPAAEPGKTLSVSWGKLQRDTKLLARRRLGIGLGRGSCR